ncbi:MAG: polyprenyl synthetase family protein [Anaerolineae bacterium]|nr:polyprenyl synthetase family protein [Anaerolineae bacterium]MDQ7037073.1 polyprenyl synthetase family protein [Anaerolineae bacterium]
MVKQIIGRYAVEFDRFMRETVAKNLTDENGYGVMVRYAMGWVNEDDTPYSKTTGKRLRPTLLLLCNETASGNWKHALAAASAVELLHNFSLIHDDIQDVSDLRHGRPTVWKIWGTANAINAGDAMFALAYTSMQRLTEYVSTEQALKAWQIFNHTNLELTRGQHLDMRFETLDKVAVGDYISMIHGKTAALLATCAQLGALIATDNDEIAQYYRDFGLNIGIAFQIRDDILGIWGEPDITGKSAATDIISRKKSLPILYGLEQSNLFVQLYTKPTFNDKDVLYAVELLDNINAQKYAREQEALYYEKAMTALEAAQPTGDTSMLRGFVDFLFQRDY